MRYSTHWLFRLAVMCSYTVMVVFGVVRFSAETYDQVVAVIGTPLAAVAWEVGKLLASKFWDGPGIARKAFLTGYIGLALLFGISLWLLTRERPSVSRRWIGIHLAVQFSIAFAVDPSPPWLPIVAIELGFVLPSRIGLAALAAGGLGLAATRLPYMLDRESYRPICSSMQPHQWELFQFAVSIMWQALAFCAGYIAAAERRGRMQLSAAHAELMATQQLLAETVRDSERVRIARDLHDAVGHHLTALKLHLELATQQAGERANAAVRVSKELAHRLLSEVRSTVAAVRAERAIDLRGALQTLCAGIPFPRIDLQFDESVQIDHPAVAQILFRCAQEAITNVVRHAAAGFVTVVLSAERGGLRLAVHDNGRGASESSDGEGNGLRGMRERIQALGGTLERDTSQGTKLTIQFPLAAVNAGNAHS